MKFDPEGGNAALRAYCDERNVTQAVALNSIHTNLAKLKKPKLPKDVGTIRKWILGQYSPPDHYVGPLQQFFEKYKILLPIVEVAEDAKNTGPRQYGRSAVSRFVSMTVSINPLGRRNRIEPTSPEPQSFTADAVIYCGSEALEFWDEDTDTYYQGEAVPIRADLSLITHREAEISNEERNSGPALYMGGEAIGEGINQHLWNVFLEKPTKYNQVHLNDLFEMAGLVSADDRLELRFSGTGIEVKNSREAGSSIEATPFRAMKQAVRDHLLSKALNASNSADSSVLSICHLYPK